VYIDSMKSQTRPLIHRKSLTSEDAEQCLEYKYAYNMLDELIRDSILKLNEDALSLSC